MRLRPDPATRRCATSWRESLSIRTADDARRELESLVKESPQFTEAHVSLSIAYYRLKRPADGKESAR